MSDYVSATVHWTGQSNSSDGEHVYSMDFRALPRLGDFIEIGWETVKVVKVVHKSNGCAHVYTRTEKSK